MPYAFLTGANIIFFWIANGLRRLLSFAAINGIARIRVADVLRLISASNEEVLKLLLRLIFVANFAPQSIIQSTITLKLYE